MEAGAVERYLENWRGEQDGAALYDAVASAEDNPKLAEIYRRLAATERKHAQLWADKLRAAGVEAPRFRPSARTRVLAWLARRWGARFVLPTVVGLEQADRNKYDAQPEAVAAGLPGDEHSHARLLTQIQRSGGGIAGQDVARLEGRHRTAGGNALRAAVLGANDGLVSNLALVMGVAGAELQERTIIITGFAGLLAGAFSMALGEWISVKSSVELHQHQMRTEAEEIEANPQEEAEELALIYQARGLDERESQALASRILTDKTGALDVMAREELGIDPSEMGGSPWVAAWTSFALFAVGAIVPVLPFLFATGSSAILGSLAFSGVALFGLGAGITLFTARPVLASGMRQMLFGLIAAGGTWAIGRLIGVTVS
ncbi:MAG TPA: VIT1/CCC1 transporter family protein [Thermoanaerobaculia bacterium]|nr:VIT1/CCC1 transporter family protein [Thermoanaerobaculia bacterium]